MGPMLITFSLPLPFLQQNFHNLKQFQGTTVGSARKLTSNHSYLKDFMAYDESLLIVVVLPKAGSYMESSCYLHIIILCLGDICMC